ncbi:MAG: potassium transporter TrkG [Candidatus Krumholzibacteriota bacterium]
MFLDSSGRFTLRPLLLVAAGMCGMAGLIIEYGTFPAPWMLVTARLLSGAAVGFFLLEQLVSWRQSGTFRRYLRSRWPTFSLSVLLVLEILALLAGRQTTWLNTALGYLSVGSVTRAYLIIIQIYIVSVFAVQLPHLHKRFASLHVRPAVAFMLTFIALILLGAGLLLLPRATPPELPLTALDALFTSTSAVCVTGLVVRDTGTEFTVFGQTVILVLIQLGGLGIMSLTAALSLLLGRGIGVRESSLLREVFQVPMLSEVGRTVRFIILMTVILETAGAVGLFLGLEGVIPDTGKRVFTAVFHAVSAFCNAGFSTFDDSLVSLSGRPLVMGTISGLLIVGGLGFGVVSQVLAWMRGRALGRTGRAGRLGLHSQVVLVVSGLLLVVGTAFIAWLEWDQSLSGHRAGAKFAQAFFQSATCRTAGFNSMDLTLLNPATLFLMIVLMFVGGAPGSTAGGVKVTTVAIIWANLRSIGRGLNRTRLGKRELEAVHVQRAMLVLSAGLVLAAISLFVLLATEEKPFLETAFEVFSALGTVGLSLGMTAALSPAGRIVITILMFVGRLGPLTLASSLTGASRDPRVRLPRGRILIG